ncbi:MAG: sensor histidine kinase [Alphaproteobacteria bacterium]|nr:sensor histidine kinase [Alphaproteobacteria bacterium]
MAGWSLRTKLVAVAAATLLPVLGIAAWQAHGDMQEARGHRAATLESTVEIAVSRHRALIEASRRLLLGFCSTEVVERAAEPTAMPADLERCEAYLGRVLESFPGEYSAAVVTDDTGVARCSSTPSAVGVSLADREIFRLVRDTRKLSISPSIASRVTPRTVIPMAVPLLTGGQFRGMCALGISLKAFAESVTTPESADGVSVVLIDRSGGPVGGSAKAAFALPVATRVAAAIAAKQASFSDYGQDGRLYTFQLAPLADDSLYAMVAAPLAGGMSALVRDWAEVVLVALAFLLALAAVWVGADRWCTQPLRYIHQFAGKVSRGEDIKLANLPPWSTEVVAIGDGVRAMADAIASRERALRAGLEQRDHMLREIHHRVKNNLQMISSLLNLQAGEIRSPRIRRFFGDAQNRVLTLSILHRHLYERSSWSLVDFQQFISDLVRQLSVGRPGVERPQPPRYHIRAPIMAVGPDTAIPVGLIVTEAVSSALRHDFTGVAQPEIRIEAVERGGHEVELVIEDNGRDTAQGSIGPGSRGGFGMTLIRGLAMQLGGSVELSPGASGGTRVVVTFTLPSEETDGG